MIEICKFSHVCFLNCFGCDVAKNATKEEKSEAKKQLRDYRKKFNINPPRYYHYTKILLLSENIFENIS